MRAPSISTRSIENGKKYKGKIIMEVRFRDAQKMARKYPKTFEAPTQEELGVLEVDHLVKVCDEEAGERFWTIIKHKDGDVITAEVNNDLICVNDYRCGDEIVFEKRHIYDIWI